MCVLCYISTDRVIDDVPFDENDRKFNIRREEKRPSCLTKRFVYYCGSSQSCGCGFGNMNITEEILRQTEQGLLAGELADEIAWLWWDQKQPPPKDKEEFDRTAEEIRASHRVTSALYRLIEETCKAGFDCELLVCWAGNEDKPVTETKEIHLDRESIDVDFTVAVNDIVLLYRFMKSG